MLSRFGVRNYKSLADVDIPLTKIHVLIGQNDSGKTSLLEAIHAFCRSTRPGVALQEAFEGRWDGRELVYLGAEGTEVAFSSQFAGAKAESEDVITGYGFTAIFRAGPGRSCVVEREWYTDATGAQNRIPMRDPLLTTVATHRQHEKIRPDWVARLKYIAEQLGASTFYRFDPDVMAVPTSIHESQRFRMEANGFGLATLLDDLLGTKPERFVELSNQFCEFFPQFRRIRIQTELAPQHCQSAGSPQYEFVMGKKIYFETQSGGAVGAWQASSGAMRFLGLLSLLYLPELPEIVMIEEPGQGVYPKRLGEAVGLLRRLIASGAAQESPQIILTTQSPHMLSYFTPEEVTLMSRHGDRVVARPLRDAPHITDRLAGGDFYLGELWYNLDEDDLFAAK